MADATFENLFIALVNCFVMITAGYAAGRLNMITPNQALGLSKFVGYFALPTLLFKNMVELQFDTVTWSLILAVFLAKSIVFFIVFFLSVLVGGGGLGRAGLYAIFATQSNDFAMGYPIIQVLYADTYPELIQYIYLLAPVQLLILNPLGFMFLEIGKQYNSSIEFEPNEVEALTAGENSPNEGGSPVERSSKLTVCKKVILGLIMNPVVIMVFVGLIFHFIFNGKLPAAIDSIVTTPSDAFAACALFYLGLTMVGKISSQKGPGLFISACLVIAKIFLVPIFARGFMLLIGSPDLHQPGPRDISNSTNENSTSYLNVLADFAYLYGTIPTAPSVIIFATQYGIEIDRMATSMVACTALSAPIMYVSAWSLTYSSVNADYFVTLIRSTYIDVSYVGIFCTTWSIFIFVASKKFQRIPHMVTLALTSSMMWMSLMTVISISVVNDNTPHTTVMLLFSLMYFGTVATRFLTASLAICLLLLEFRGEEPARKFSKYLVGAPIVLAAAWTLITSIGGDTSSVVPVDIAYGKSDIFTLIMSIIMLISSLSVTCVSLVVLFRKTSLLHRHNDAEDDAAIGSASNQSSGQRSSIADDPPLFADDDDVVLINDLSSDDERRREIRRFDSSVLPGGHEFTRHVCLLMCLSLSMLMGTVLITWQINGSAMTGSYTELAFLDSVCSVGQGLFVFFIFGFDNEIIVEPMIKLYRKLTGKGKQITLPEWSEVGLDTLRTCAMFVKYNLHDCKKSIETSHRRSMRTYEKGFTGSALVEYLVDARLVNNKHEATLFGEDLLKGRVLRHSRNQYHFHDMPYLYQFIEPGFSYPPTTFSSADESTSMDSARAVVGTSQPQQAVLMFEFENYLLGTTPVHSRRQPVSPDEGTPLTRTEVGGGGRSSSLVKSCASEIADICGDDDDDGDQKNYTNESREF